MFSNFKEGLLPQTLVLGRYLQTIQGRKKLKSTMPSMSALAARF
ncbi:MAG: hypothetical protein ACI8XG_001777 [Congregibacter sp.]|jgi:hypothetical protein